MLVIFVFFQVPTYIDDMFGRPFCQSLAEDRSVEFFLPGDVVVGAVVDHGVRDKSEPFCLLKIKLCLLVVAGYHVSYGSAGVVQRFC